VDFVITPAAEKFILRMTRFGNVPAGGGFRLAVSPGGCSGLAAEFEVLAQPRAGDAVVERNGLRLFLPAESRLLLEGVTIDCADSPTDSGLVFRDPKISGPTCGTPSSGSVELVNLSTPPRVRG
jgi:iron-sulfur cluster assembly accessory protein